MNSRVLERKNKGVKKNLRINLVFSIFILLFAVLEMRLFQIQVLSHNIYLSAAEEQYKDSQVLPAKRGNILTYDGYVLAGNQIFYLLYAEPKFIDDKYKFSHDLAQVLAEIKSAADKKINIRENSESEKKNGSGNGDKNADENGHEEKGGSLNNIGSIATESENNTDSNPADTSDLFSTYYDDIFKLVNKGLMWVPIEHGISPEDREKIESLNFKGIGFEEETSRYYPEKMLASQVLGFVASNEKGEKVGYYGIEGRLNEDLRGKPGKISEETDALGTPILIGGYKKVEPIQGRDIILTLRRPVQYIVENLIKEGVEKYNAVSGSVVVMDPYTGDVLAMANYPTYLPSEYSKTDEEKKPDERRKAFEKKNAAISNTYEAGSVIKPFTVSTAIDLGLIKPETTYEDNGPAVYSGRTIDNWDRKHLGTLNIIGLLQKSNNIGAAWVGHLVGSKKLDEYFTNFGLGTKTNIELEGEESGYIKKYEDWRDIDLAVMSFGQGFATTPLQVLNGFNVFANGGYLLEPKIIYSVKDDKKEIVMPTKNLRRVITKQTADTMVDMLEKAVEGGEAKFFTLKDYRIAGKTGTAEVADEKGGYAADRSNATFVGFLAGSRKFSMIVRLEEPKTSIYAAETAVPLWMDMATELVKYYGIAQDKIINQQSTQ